MATVTGADRQVRGRDGQRPAVRDVSLTPSARRVRIPELAGGVLLAVLCGAGVLAWHLQSVERVPALAAAADIERGEVLSEGDLRVVRVSGGSELARITPSEAQEVVGQVAVVDLAVGALLTEEQLSTPDELVGSDDGVVGMVAEPGQMPGDLVPGDVVNVVRIGAAGTAPSGDGASTEAGTQAAGTPLVVARGVAVVAIDEVSGRTLVTLAAPTEEVELIASFEGGALRLVRVPT